MKRANCKHCEKELVHVEGRRPKEFCKDSCRVAYHYKHHPKDKKKVVVEDLPQTKNQVNPIAEPKAESLKERQKTKEELQDELKRVESEVMPQYLNANVWKPKHKKRIEELKLLISNAK